MGELHVDITVGGGTEFLSWLMDEPHRIRVVVRTNPPSCGLCIANAASENPILAPLHPRCDCENIIE